MAPNQEQMKAVELVLNRHNVLIYGGIGTGKTFTSIKCIKELKAQKKLVYVTATTGVASLNLGESGAITIHSWAGLKDGRYGNNELYNKINDDLSMARVKNNILSVETLFIDEISMLSAKLFSQLDYVCRMIRSKPEIPFGGIQVVCAGDFEQLKPVPNPLYGDNGDYAFLSESWKVSMNHVCVLKEVMRQNELQFITVIKELARGKLGKDSWKFLREKQQPLEDDADPVYLHARRYETMLQNYDFLDMIKQPPMTYKAVDEGEKRKLNGLGVDKFLCLKVGAKVMLLVNKSHKLVNGSIGFVHELQNNKVVVSFPDVGYQEIEPEDFTIYDPGKGVIASRQQIPLKLAYALSIHKAEGMNLDYAVVDLSHCYQAGQAATAIGRVRNSKGLQVTNLRHLMLVKQPQAIIDFNESCNHESDILADFTCCRNQRTGPITTAKTSIIEETPGIEDDGYEEDSDEALLVHEQLVLDLIADTRSESQAPTSDTPIPVPFKVIKEAVVSDFVGKETKEQILLFEKHESLDNAKIHKFISTTWTRLDEWYKSSMKGKVRGKMEAKDFTIFTNSCDSYVTSDSFTRDMYDLYGDVPLRIEHSIAYRYFDVLRDKYLAHVELSTRDDSNTEAIADNDGENSIESISHSCQGTMRYCTGYSCAKTKYKLKTFVENNIHKSERRKEVHLARLKVDLLQSKITTQEKLERTTSYPESLNLIKRKQNARMGLTHVTDDMFEFFFTVDREVNKHMTKPEIANQQSIFVDTEKAVCDSKDLFNHWKLLFSQEAQDQEFLEELKQLMIATITPFLHIKFDQFRIDLNELLRERKGIEIRKQLYDKKRTATDIGTEAPSKKKKLTLGEYNADHDIHAEIVSGKINLKQFYKADLQALAKAYGIKITKKMNVEILTDKIKAQAKTTVPTLVPAAPVSVGSTHLNITSSSIPSNTAPGQPVVTSTVYPHFPSASSHMMPTACVSQTRPQTFNPTPRAIQPVSYQYPLIPSQSTQVLATGTYTAVPQLLNPSPRVLHPAAYQYSLRPLSSTYPLHTGAVHPSAAFHQVVNPNDRTAFHPLDVSQIICQPPRVISQPEYPMMPPGPSHMLSAGTVGSLQTAPQPLNRLLT